MRIEGCQLPCVPTLSEGAIEEDEPQTLVKRIKRFLAVPWNYHVKKWLKNFYKFYKRSSKNLPLQPEKVEVKLVTADPNYVPLQANEWVRIKSLEEIQSTLDPFKELKGCAFLPYMAQYCGTTQQVLHPMRRFLDERDYKVKKVKGVVLLTSVFCEGTPVFGQCDRRCLFFWREEWLERVQPPVNSVVARGIPSGEISQ